MRSKKMKKWSICIYWLLAMLFWEAFVHIGMYGAPRGNFRYALSFTAAIGLTIGVLISLLPRKAVFPVSVVLSAVLIFVYGSQLVYCFIFATPYSVSQIGLGGDAVNSFWREMLATMASHILWLIGLFVPLVALILIRKRFPRRKIGWVPRVVPVLIAVELVLVAYLDISFGGTAMFSDYYFFTSKKSTTMQTMERFGVPMTFYLELTHTGDLDESGAEVDELLAVIPEPTVAATEATLPVTEPENDEIPEESIPVETEPKLPEYNILDVDFDALNQKTDNSRILALNNYFSQIPGTKKNEYTGMLKDYNLILICAESFSPAAVDPVVTPTLYKLTHEGFLFKNFYTSYPNTTTDGEYILAQGLYPDAARGKFDSSMLMSQYNSLPFTLGNAFAEQRGVQSWGYHNYLGSYYNRVVTHANMGYKMKFSNDGMKFSSNWPASDLEMMEQSVDDYIHQPQFNVYYMTFSGHYQYSYSTNCIAARNKQAVKDLPYSEEEQAYLACHVELDKALEYLMKRLEEEGVADHTAIVMAADHTPYGLSKKSFYHMIGEQEDFLNWYRSDLLFWVGGLEEPVEVDAYCCDVDILPTLLNLWGFQYDSRMLAGTDVFSDSTHIAVLSNHSFLTDQVWFNSNTGQTRYQVDESQVPADYVANINRLITARFDFSAKILQNNYYHFAFEE